MVSKFLILLLSAILFVISFVIKQLNEPKLFVVPSNFPKPVYNFDQNPLTKDGIALGKMLFYDAALSKDNTVSCGSCHQQSAGFTQHGHALSHGVGDQFTKRNAMPLANLAWANSFGWDGGVHDLDLFAVSPITNPLEMDETLANVYEKLRKTDKYPTMFEKAFGSPEINTERFLKAISQFTLTMVSGNSKYDHYMRNEGVNFTNEELEGMEIFNKKCSSCHSGALFTDFSFRNNGLSIDKNNDKGRYEITQNDADLYRFKVPSLRNLAYTAPYMHDGRFGSLALVIDHYTASVVSSPSLDDALKPNGISLTANEKQKILTFLNTLNDDNFLSNNDFAENFASDDFNKKVNYDKEIVTFKNLDPKLKNAINVNFKNYLAIKNAIAAQNSELAAKNAEKYLEYLGKIKVSLMTEPQKAFFSKLKNELSFNAEHIIEGHDELEHQLDHFYEFSKDMYLLNASFTSHNTPQYFYACQNTTTKWLSDLENESNNQFSKIDCKNLEIIKF